MLWWLARWVHEHWPALGVALGRIRRRLIPQLYLPESKEKAVPEHALATDSRRADGDVPGTSDRSKAATLQVVGAAEVNGPSIARAEVAELEPAIERTSASTRIRPIDVEFERRGVVHYVGSLQAGGAERQVVYTLAGLKTRGFGAALVVSEGLQGRLGHYLPMVKQSGVPYRWAGAAVDPAFLQLLEQHPEVRDCFHSIPVYLQDRVADAAAEFMVMRPSIVHCWLDHTNLWGGVAAQLAGVRHVILSGRNVSPIHFPHLMLPWFRDWYRWLLEQPGVCMINNSHPGARDYAEWLGVDASRIGVILNGLDTRSIRHPTTDERQRARRAMTRSPSDRVVVGVARLSDEKQPMVFIEVARRICALRPNVTFALVGDGMMKSAVNARIKASGLRSRIKLLGRRHHAGHFMAAADVFLLTSRAEGTPNVLLESQYLGCPPVSTKAGGAVDAVIDGQTGYLADVGDVEGLTERVLRLLDDEPLRAAMSTRGPAFVEERFGLDRMIDETVELYDCLDPDGEWRRMPSW